jgi:ABC-type branched-subunit amino acid transport system substrate-binding protein
MPVSHQDDAPLRSRLPRRAVVLGGTGLATLALAGCAGGGLPGFPGFDTGPSAEPAPTGPAAPADTLGTGQVKVGLILPLSAAGQGAVAGNALRNAAELALSEFQGAEIQLLVRDDQGTAAGAQAAAQQVISEGAELIIGPLFAGAVQAAGQVARGASRPVIAFSTDASVASRGVYLLSFLAETEVERIVDFASQQGKKSFAALIPETAYGRVVEGQFQQSVAKRGARVVAVERYAAGRAAEAIGRLARVAGGATPQADAVLLPEGAEGLPAVAQALQTAGINLSRVRPLGTGVWNDPRVFRIPQLAGGWFAAPDATGFNAFATRYRARFNSDPTRIATLAYDAVSLAAALTRTQGSQRFAEATLTNASGFAGTDGVFRFRPDGTNERALAVMEVRSGAFVTVSAAPRSLAPAT